jgi:predicted AlkP superfamily phosphohydrolase/phosphomutase
VLVIGVDAATWTVIDPLLAAGKLPTLGRLVAEGWSGTLLSIKPMLSPRLWTTIATGKMADQHGIGGFLAPVGEGEAVPVTSNLRRVETLWTIAGRAGRRVNVVGWYVTWPVEPVNGVMVSDRFVPPEVLPKDTPAPDQAVYPPDLAPELAKLFVSSDEFILEGDREFHKTFKVYPVDASRVAITAHLMRTRPADLTMVYLRGTDTIQHVLWRYYQPAEWIGPPGDVPFSSADSIPDYYEVVDELLGRLVALTGPRDTILVVSDHGAGPVQTYDPHTRMSGEHRVEGVIIAYGNHVRRGKADVSPGLLDITPTVLYLLGLPVGEDMPGAVIQELIDPAFARAHPVQRVATHEPEKPRPQEAPIKSPMDESIRTRLRSLGYIE